MGRQMPVSLYRDHLKAISAIVDMKIPCLLSVLKEYNNVENDSVAQNLATKNQHYLEFLNSVLEDK